MQRTKVAVLLSLLAACSTAALTAGQPPVRLPAADGAAASARRMQPAEELPLNGQFPTQAMRAEPPAELGAPAGFQPGEEPLWTLADVEQIALASHPALAVAAARIDAERGRYWQAGVKPNPEIGYAASEIGSEGSAGQQGASLSQTFLLGHKRAWRQAAAGQQIAVAEQQWQSVRQQVLTDVRMQFQQTLLAQYRLDLLARLLEVSRQTESTVGRLLDAQEARRIDLLQARVQAEKIALQHRQAEVRLHGAWRMLLAAVGDSALTPRPLRGDLRELAPHFTWETVESRLRAESPTLARAASEIERQRVEIGRQQAEGVPDVTAGVQVAKETATDDTIASVSVTLPLPLWNRNQGNVAAAEAEYRAAQQEYRRLELALSRRLAGVYQQYREARLEVQRYEESILPAASETLQLVRRVAEAGEANYLEVFTIQRTSVEAHLDYLQALERLNGAALRVEGMLLEGALELEP